MTDKVIKIGFSDFWPHLAKDNYFLRLLQKHFNVVESVDPDYLFYSVYGQTHLKHDCIKICFTGENVVPDFNLCDYALGFHYLNFDDRYLRFPLYVIYPGYEALANKAMPNADVLLNRKFCNFVYSNNTNSHPARELFFKQLSEYKRIDSGGKFLNNLGFTVGDKISFIQGYKFTLAMENSSVPGYTTEKIMEPMTVNSMPVYWGNPLLHLDFNEASLVNVMRYPSFEAAIQEIIRLDTDEHAYVEKLSLPWLTPRDWEGEILHFFEKIFNQDLEAAKRAPRYGFGQYNRMEKIQQADLLTNQRKSNRFKASALKLVKRFTK
ncbi:MAG: hypothetical protein JNM78_19175 [Cyclobacteriaceae bacterium]|nr:hypothetical protein [Cyclobacteriaceae bacterium]